MSNRECAIDREWKRRLGGALLVLVVVILLIMPATGGFNAIHYIFNSKCLILEPPSGKALQKANHDKIEFKGVEAEHLSSSILNST